MFSHSLPHSSQLMQTNITGLQMYYFINIPEIPVARPRSTLQVHATWEARKGTTEHRGESAHALFSQPLAHFSAALGLCFHSRYSKYCSLFYSFSGYSLKCLPRCTMLAMPSHTVFPSMVFLPLMNMWHVD